MKVSAADEAAIRALEARRHAALVAVDLSELDAIFDDDLVHVHTNGLSQTKSELLEHVSKNRHYLAFERGPLTFRGLGDLAIVTGSLTNHMRGEIPDTPRMMRAVATQVVRRTPEGRWRFLSFHSCVDRTGPA